jgi:hypothetical protein
MEKFNCRMTFDLFLKDRNLPFSFCLLDEHFGVILTGPCVQVCTIISYVRIGIKMNFRVIKPFEMVEI